MKQQNIVSNYSLESFKSECALDFLDFSLMLTKVNIIFLEYNFQFQLPLQRLFYFIIQFLEFSNN